MEVTTKKQNRRKIVIGVLIAVVVLVAAVIVFASSYLVNYAIGRSGDGGDREVALDVEAPTDGVEQLIAENRAVQKQANEEFLQQNPGQTVQITAADGLRLNGVYYPNAGSHLWVIALHGYRGSHTGVTNLAQHYHDAGYQVLTPDLRACGDSEGDYVGMGWLDRKDVLQWIDWVLAQDSEAEIVLHGVSMGAATTMNIAGERTPGYVKCFVEDCGYTSAWDEFAHEMKKRFDLHEFPLLYVSSMLCKLKYGWSFGEASPVRQLKNSHKPMLFIHGGKDDFVPTEMVYPCYEAKPQPKSLWIAPGSAHAVSYRDHKKEYTGRVKAFVEKWNR
jgi:fermentation-respiration switch protein FrsA (DUF1100 family)